MSRQNKVNPGMYTQRGRLTQDDAAREIAKQRNVGSPNTWQPVEKDQLPSLESKDENADEVTETSGDTSGVDTKPAAASAQPFRQLINKTKPSPKAKAKAAKPAAAKSAKPAKRTAKPASRRPAKTAARKTKKAAPATKRGKAKSARPARAAKPKAKAAKRRKS